MALDRATSPPWPRVGPNRIFPELSGTPNPLTTLLVDTQVTRLVHNGERIAAVHTRNTRTGEERSYQAAAFVVCADTMRTPQILFNSGIRPPALGRYLNEHAFLVSTFWPDTSGRERELPEIEAGEWRAGSYWLPHSDEAQPFHAQIVETYRNQRRAPEDYTIGLTWYAATAARYENGLVFSDTEVDAAGMPRMSVQFGHDKTDRAAIDRAGEDLAAVSRELGGNGDWELLPAGASLHFTGTVRMGKVNDGTSVCDTNCKVWGYDNLYVAGNGVIPTSMLANTTLTGAVTAVRAGRAAASQLGTL